MYNFDLIAIQVEQMLKARENDLLRHLCHAGNRLKLTIKIQSDTEASFSLETFTKRSIVFDGEPQEHLETSSFNVRKYQKEIVQAVRHYVTSCRFYPLPLVLNIFVSSDNAITGNFVSNFVFKDN